ncbi:ABC transporter ATP-binding protein [Variovorax sp. VNK109]|uniref:ABC transporter ATP-binding protein n=1 Tax=Variovorax sp. VNK109 TaxID=3400919 RepID=UPI003C061E80
MTTPLLEVDRLCISVRGDAGFHPVVRDLSFSVGAGENLAIVGESGCGKSITALSILGLLPPGSVRVDSGSIRFEGQDLLKMPERDMRALRGNRIAMIFQEPMTSLNPVLTIGDQIAEAVSAHQDCGRRAAWTRAVEVLERVRIPDAPRRAKMYPHQLSGGMRQRVMIAMALACKPRLIVADEPTTALDVTIQAQILALLGELQRDLGTSVVLITHDLGVVCEVADRVVVLYAGARAEEAPVAQLFRQPSHPYTRGLMASIPRRASQMAPQDDAVTRLAEIRGAVPSPDRLPPGCAFANRCPRALERCPQSTPPLHTPSAGHVVACFNPELVAQEMAA